MLRIAIVLSSFLLGGCFNLNVVHSGADSFRGANTKTALVQSTETESGGVSATISASSNLSQLVSAPETSAASGTRVVFPPGSLSIDTSITIEESAAVATDTMGADLELNTTVQQSGVAIMVKSEANVDAKAPFTLSIPLPVSTGLALNDSWDKLIVMYRVKVASSDKTMAGIIPRSDIIVENGMARFSTQYFGAFQTALTQEAVLEKKEVETKAQIVSKAESIQLPPISVKTRLPFVINANKTMAIQGSNFRATMIVALGGKKVGNLQVLSDSKATFTAPEVDGFGLANVSVEQDGITQSVSVFYAGTASDYPIITEAETEVCSGKKYYDLNGVLKTGSKVCGGVQADLTNLTAANIVAGVTINGVVGTAALAPANCTADNAVGCVTTASYPSVYKAGLSATDIRSGVSVAGITGTLSASYSSCSSDGQTNCLASLTFPAVDKNALTTNATKIRSSLTIANVAGTLADCSADGDAGCVAVGPSYAAALTAGAAAKILSGQTVGGISGSAAIRPADCSADGSIGCVTTSSYPALDKSGSLLPNLSKIRTSVTIAGYSGSLADCSTDGASGCVANGAFPATDSSFLSPGNIRSGVTLGGIAGDFPSLSYPLNPGDGFSDLDNANFNIKIKSSSSFGWFDRNGVRYSAAGNSNLAAANIKSGISFFGELGTFGVNCSSDGQTNCLTTSNYRAAFVPLLSTYDIRKGVTVGGVVGTLAFNNNGANFSTFNRTTGPAADAGSSVADIYDSIDDYNNAGAMPFLPQPSSSLFMGWFSDTATDTNSNGVCDGGESCVLQDPMTNLRWAMTQGSALVWESAISHCDGLTYGGSSDWRLPTQKEFLQAYIDGIWYHKAAAELNLSSANYWTATTTSNDTANAWAINPSQGILTYSTKSSTSYSALCVR